MNSCTIESEKVNATSISENLLKIAGEHSDLKSALDAIAVYLKETSACRVYFGRLYGKRCSFFAGDRELAYAAQACNLTAGFVLYFDQIGKIDRHTWRKIQNTLRKIIEELHAEDPQR